MEAGLPSSPAEPCGLVPLCPQINNLHVDIPPWCLAACLHLNSVCLIPGNWVSGNENPNKFGILSGFQISQQLAEEELGGREAGHAPLFMQRSIANHQFLKACWSNVRY